jgi:uncharacterized membrane protein YagU involved in acid resistance
MSEFNLLPALVAGFIATMVMTAMMTMASKAGMTRMPPMPPVMGSMMSGDRRKAMAIGSMLHFVVMGTIVFGIGYALVFRALGSTAWWLGVVIGLVHGMAVGLVFMPMMPFRHPWMDAQLVGAGAPVDGAAVTEVGGQVRLVGPGVLGSSGAG